MFESFNYFETLFNNTRQNTIILMDSTGIILEVNKAFCFNFGYDEQEIKGRNFEILFTDEDCRRELPKREISTVLHEGQAYDNNYLVNRNNAATWVSGESILIKNDKGDTCILKMIQNIHVQKESEASVIRLHDLNKTMLGSIADAVVVLGAGLKILQANQSFFNLFGKDENTREPIVFLDYIIPFDTSLQLAAFVSQSAASSNFSATRQIEFYIPAINDKRIFDVSCSTLDSKGGQENILLVFHDITALKQSEREREDIIGFVAHELRNPLANIILCNEMMTELAGENDMDGISAFLQRSKNNVLRLNKMIAELYDSTKVSSGNFLLEISTFEFHEMIREAVETIQGLQPTYQISIKGAADFMVTGDRYRLIQVVTNFLSNGIKYSDGKKNVVIILQKNADNIIVSVKDEGLGVPKDQLPYIFDRFFRAEKTKNLEGIGLGLYLCKQIVHAHHGTIWVESEEGQGSTFCFSIPINAG